jgi:hypothetical protein
MDAAILKRADTPFAITPEDDRVSQNRDRLRIFGGEIA